MSALAGATVAGTSVATAEEWADGAAAARTQQGQIGRMLFPSTSGLLSATGDPLTEDSLVAVAAEPTAVVRDRDGEGDAVTYPEDVDVPLVGVDDVGAGTVVGVGAPLVNDGDLVPELEGEDPLGDLGNEEFLLNVYDEYAEGTTVQWDESHGQFYDLGRFANFAAYAESEGYTVESTADLTTGLADAGTLVVTSPAESFGDAELDAVTDFVADGGLLVLHDQSDFSNFDATDNLNAVADALDLGFRFNDAEVGDPENNVGIDYLPLTANFNTDFPLFADRPGITIDLQRGEEYDVDVVDVADGDTFDVVFDAEDVGLEADYTATVRVLGIDTPESAGIAESAERPEEWEGLAYDAGAVDPIDRLVFDSTASLLDADREPLTEDSLVAVYAEPTATNEDSDGNGDAVSYPSETDIPLVAVEDRVVGVGAPFVNGLDPTTDNEEFLLNVYDQVIDGATVLWDESHGQFYTLEKFEQFEGYAESEGYTVEPTTDLLADIDGADAVVVTSPAESFSDAELDAVTDFVADGGAVLLHDQSDFDDFDATANLNAVADALDLGFRFNDDQVIDESENAGQPFVPATTNFAGPDALFVTREGIDDDPDARTTPYLVDRASAATEFAVEALADSTVTLSFDANEPLRDPTRYLAYAEYDAGSGSRDTLYNRAVIEEGYGRVYGSSLSRHDDFWAAERAAREAGRGVWAESDLADATPFRERPLDELFVPEAASVRTTTGDGRVPADQVLLAAESTATQEGGSVGYDQPPLFAVDGDDAVAVGGSLLIDESYERLEGFDADTSGFANYSFVTSVVDALAGGDGPVYVDGGHGQFGVDYALSNEDAAYYQRHLEGRGVNFEQINDLTRDRLSSARALIVTTPVTAFTEAELDAVRTFRDEGGAVVLLGTAAAPASARANLNSVAAALGTDLRLSGDRVVDLQNNLAGDPTIPTTEAVDALPLLTPRFDDGDGEVEFDEIMAAIERYNEEGTVSFQDILDIIRRYNGPGTWPAFGG